MKRGPEIKMPELHVPQFLVDLYYDLYDRHLLPVVGVLLVGIVAIPLLLGGSSGSGKASPSGEAAASAAASAEPSAMLVKKAAPGLRDYRRRLTHLHPKDPFRQQYTTKEGGGEEESTSGGSTSTEVEGESSETGGGVESGGAESGGTIPAPVPTETKTKVTFLSVAIDVRVTPVSAGDGKPSDAGPSVRRNLPPLVALPSRETPALTYMGPSRDGRKALMVVSSDVTSLFGDSPCLIGSETCQLLALEPGLPETIVWGANGRTFEIELLKMHLVASDHLNRNSFGKPKHSAPAGRP
jgi:hypothetical protein